MRLTPEDRLQPILDALPAGSHVTLAPGIYRQKAVIRTPGLTITGEGPEETVIVWGDYARKPHPVGWEYNTFRTYTLAVCADNVTIRGISVVNDAGSPTQKGQEVALSVVATGFSMEDCVLSSTQDTLFLGPLPSDLIGRYEGFLPDELRRGGPMTQRFRNCLVKGTVDFIFGRGSALFGNCEIRSLGGKQTVGYVTAPAQEAHQTEGFRFQACRFTCEESVAPGSVFLGRPWRDHGMAVFEDCEYGRHIAPAGFDPWSGTRRDLTARFSETPPVAGRVDWINRREKSSISR